jgi:two-component system LytT family response regulator
MQRLKIFIVDDEKRARISLAHVIRLHDLNAEIYGEASSIKEAETLLKQKNPDVLLLDIKISDGSGFELLERMMPLKFKVIFITAYNQYAIQAFRYHAIHYLVKPVVPAELVNALNHARQVIQTEQENQKLRGLLKDLKKEEGKIVLKTQEATYVLSVNEIIRCEADRNYTRFFLLNKKNILVSGGLKEYEDMLKPYKFIRPHHSHLVNPSFILRLDKKGPGMLLLKDGSEIPVSTRKHSEIVQQLKNLS